MAENEDSWWDGDPFFVAHHDSGRREAITASFLEQANNCNYDLLTIPVTTDAFRARVLKLLGEHQFDSKFDAESSQSAVQSPFPEVPPLGPEDTPLSPEPFNSQLLAVTSSWIDVCSPDPVVADISKQVLLMEMSYAAFCGFEYVLVSGPRLYHGDGNDVSTLQITQFARVVYEALTAGGHMHVSLRIPMCEPPEGFDTSPHEELDKLSNDEYARNFGRRTREEPDYFEVWDAWNIIRSTCKYNPRLAVALTFPSILPPNSVLSRWLSEPVKAIILRPESFVPSGQGAISLPTVAQAFIYRLMRSRYGPWLILEDVDPIPRVQNSFSGEPIDIDNPDESLYPTPAEASQPKAAAKVAKDPFAHLRYIRLLQQNQPPRTVEEKYGSGYQDYLQIPLQPLADNLESITYEVFEKDPVKYNLYEEAIAKALRDWEHKKKPRSGPNGKVVVAVVGAGRGPLVTRALKASRNEGVDIDLWCVEKNPNAFVLLQKHARTIWDGQVKVIKSDMRSWQGPERFTTSSTMELETPKGGENSPPVVVPEKEHYKIDIIISELLGSFADNELSPECLDGVLHLLAPNGISIPRSYTAYMTPIAAQKLYSDISSRATWDSTAYETPAVVWLHAIDFLSSKSGSTENGDQNGSMPDGDPNQYGLRLRPEVKGCWSFYHEPLGTKQTMPLSNTHNSRFTRLDFPISNRGVCHGLGGYFESVLYPGVELSTHPNTMDKKSNSMISWFPIFFPLKTPMYIPDNSELTVSIWRQTDNRKVWYEWMLESWVNSTAPNGSNQRARLGSSELHSSQKNGCLM